MSAFDVRGPHPREGLQDLFDERLSPAEAASIRAHLASCAECHREWRRLETARAAAAVLRAPRELPVAFDAMLRARLQQVDAEAEGDSASTKRDGRTDRWRSDRRTWFAAAAAGFAALAIAIWRGQSGVRDELVAGVFANHAAVAAERVPLERRTADPAELEAYFAATGLPEIRVLDLAMMRYVLEGGRVASLAGSPAALYVYRDPSGAPVVCQMYRGRVEALPPADAVRPRGAFVFHLFTRGEASAVFWQEGPIVCVLAATLPTDAVFGLAVEKAMLPA